VDASILQRRMVRLKLKRPEELRILKLKSTTIETVLYQRTITLR